MVIYLINGLAREVKRNLRKTTRVLSEAPREAQRN